MLALSRRGRGFAVRLAGREWIAERPVGVRWAGEPGPATHRYAYDGLDLRPDGAEGHATVEHDGATVTIIDTWRVDGEQLAVRRVLRVSGTAADGGVASGVALETGSDGWNGWAPFAPAAVYGDWVPVGEEFIGSPAHRRRGAHAILVREDRLSAPVFALLPSTGAGLAVHDAEPDAATTRADAADRNGSTIVDARIRVMSLGAELVPEGILVGAWYPAREGDVVYDSGGLPLGQHAGWRERMLPLVDGTSAEWCAVFAGVAPGTYEDGMTAVWRAAWRRARPAVEPVAEERYLRATAGVLAGQARSAPGGRLGIGLESDPVTGRPVPGSDRAVMGFVGANTDAALALLIAAREPGADPAHAELAAGILDAFAQLEVAPPAGEGFDLATGLPCCYREIDGVEAVFLRALAEGLLAALRASELAGRRGDAWRDWALRGTAWLLGQQHPDGTFPRAWVAGTGEVLQDSRTATVHAVPLLVALAERGDTRARRAAVAAGEASWRRYARGGGFAGATLDNPDVVDKEAAVFALEGYLELQRMMSDVNWTDRALAAARAAETWIQLWTPPMPADAGEAELHWKRGRSAVGMQGITTGVTMTDGFLAVNAVAFVRLARLTADPHWLDVAYTVFHGSKAMLATTDDSLDLAGAGWQQEHWNLGPDRGFGLNRHWLPWAAVATLRGHQRLVEHGDVAGATIARGRSGHPA